MKKLLIGAFIALLSSNAMVIANEAKSIKVAFEGVYPPFNYVEDGELTGFDVDIATALCEQARFKCEFVIQNWDGIIPGLLAHKYDAIIASMSITEERKKRVDFSEKYYNTPQAFIARKEDGIANVSAKSIAGKIFGAQGNGPQAAYIEDNFQDNELKIYDTVDNASADLAAGRVDIVLSDKVVLQNWIDTNRDGDCCAQIGKDLRDSSFGPGKGVAVRKGEEELRDAFTAAISAIVKNGVYKKINAKYFPFSVY